MEYLMTPDLDPFKLFTIFGMVPYTELRKEVGFGFHHRADKAY